MQHGKRQATHAQSMPCVSIQLLLCPGHPAKDEVDVERKVNHKFQTLKLLQYGLLVASGGIHITHAYSIHYFNLEVPLKSENDPSKLLRKHASRYVKCSSPGL